MNRRAVHQGRQMREIGAFAGSPLIASRHSAGNGGRHLTPGNGGIWHAICRIVAFFADRSILVGYVCPVKRGTGSETVFCPSLGRRSVAEPVPRRTAVTEAGTQT